LTLFRDYSQHVVDPVRLRNNEVEELKISIEKLVQVLLLEYQAEI
jgi:hypothetical protein